MGKKAALPVLILAIGIGLLLDTKDILEPVNWVWTIALGTGGLIIMMVGGWNQVTVIIGPVLITSAVLSYLHATGRVGVAEQVPILVIAVGVLSLVAMTCGVPRARWLSGPKPEDEGGGKQDDETGPPPA